MDSRARESVPTMSASPPVLANGPISGETMATRVGGFPIPFDLRISRLACVGPSSPYPSLLKYVMPSGGKVSVSE